MRIYKRTGSPKWWATWNDQKGQRVRKSTGTNDKQLAEAIAAKWQHESFMEQHFGIIPDTPFRDALLRYATAKKRENARGYEDTNRYQLQMLLDKFGDKMLSEIDAKLLRDFADTCRETQKDASLQRYLAVIKAILNKAKDEGDLLALPVFPKVKQPKGRTRWLTVEEEHRLLKASPERIRLLIAFALDTGGRRSELFRLDWRYLDLEQGRVTFVETKNGEDRSIRLTERAKQILVALGPKGSGAVFTYQGKALKGIKTSFDTARTKAGLEDFRFHDLRHTFASRLVQKGLPLYEVMHMTGHKSLTMVQRYSHLAPEYQERAIEALNTYGESPWFNPGHNLGTVAADDQNDQKLRQQKSPVNQALKMVPSGGIEPPAPSLPMTRPSPNASTGLPTRA